MVPLETVVGVKGIQTVMSFGSPSSRHDSLHLQHAVERWRLNLTQVVRRGRGPVGHARGTWAVCIGMCVSVPVIAVGHAEVLGCGFACRTPCQSTKPHMG